MAAPSPPLAAPSPPLSISARRWLASAAPALAWAGVGVPFDVVKTRLQTTSQARFRSAWHCLAHTVRTEGALALWKGLTPQILISLPSSTLLFGTYQQFRPEPLPAGADRGAFYGGVFVAGCGSGVALTALQNPLDVWRTRLQTTYGDAPPPPPATSWRSA